MMEISTPILEGKSVSTLIPQKPPIEMVDKLWYIDETKTISGFEIKEDNIFCKDGFFIEPGLIENIAQTASLRVGYVTSIKNTDKEDNDTPPLGYIGGIKKLIIHQLPKVGDELRTEVTIQHIIFDVIMMYGKSMIGEKVVAECEMKIFLKRD